MNILIFFLIVMNFTVFINNMTKCDKEKLDTKID